VKKFGALFLSVVLVVTMVGWLSTRSTMFRLSSVVVRSTDVELASAVEKHLARYLSQSMLALSLSDIELDVKKDLRIFDVRLRKRWPSTLLVILELRKALFRGVGGELYDQFGQAYKVPSSDLLKVPELRNSVPMPERELLARWLDEMQSSKFEDFQRLSTLSWSSERGLVVRTDHKDIDILLGFDHFEHSWARAASILSVVSNEGSADLRSIDASYNQRAILGYATKLQNSPNGLNLKEIVRRMDPKTHGAGVR